MSQDEYDPLEFGGSDPIPLGRTPEAKMEIFPPTDRDALIKRIAQKWGWDENIVRAQFGEES